MEFPKPKPPIKPTPKVKEEPKKVEEKRPFKLKPHLTTRPFQDDERLQQLRRRMGKPTFRNR